METALFVKKIKDRLKLTNVMPYFSIIGAIIALGAWWLSTVTADNARRLEQRVSAAVDRFEADRRASTIERFLSNAQKQATRIELNRSSYREWATRLARIEANLGIENDNHIYSEQQHNMLREFGVIGDEFYWTQNLWSDFDLIYWERERMLRDLTDTMYPPCPARLLRPATQRLQRVAACIEDIGVSGFDTEPVITQLRTVQLPETATACIHDRARHVDHEVSTLYAAFRDSMNALRIQQNNSGTISISMANPNFEQMEIAGRQLSQMNRIARQCIGPEYLGLSNEISRVRQSLIHYARHDLLPNRQFEAKIAGIGAIFLYVLGAFLGIVGKWGELHRKNSSD